jgi:vacuolar-type H+-ATPase subunit F/Vma7
MLGEKEEITATNHLNQFEICNKIILQKGDASLVMIQQRLLKNLQETNQHHNHQKTKKLIKITFMRWKRYFIDL